MPPQKFIHDYDLREEAHSFDFSQAHWISGDGAWGRGKEDASLPDEVWRRIREAIRMLDVNLKAEKVSAAKVFMQKVELESASMADYILFRNLFEEEIQKIVHQHTVVNPRDDMTFALFDTTVCAKQSQYIGIKFGNGHLEHMDQLLRERGCKLTTIKWARILTV